MMQRYQLKSASITLSTDRILLSAQTQTGDGLFFSAHTAVGNHSSGSNRLFRTLGHGVSIANGRLLYKVRVVCFTENNVEGHHRTLKPEKRSCARFQVTTSEPLKEFFKILDQSFGFPTS